MLSSSCSGLMTELVDMQLQLPARLTPKRRHHQNIFHALIHTMKKTTSNHGDSGDGDNGDADNIGDEEDGLLNLDEELQEDSRESVGNLDYTIARSVTREEEEVTTTQLSASSTTSPTSTGKL